MTDSKIKNFFRDQTVFVTGGTGFLGKVLVEKLLRLCEPKKIYILVRPKKGKTTEERFDDFFSYVCFDRVKSAHDLKNKVVFINGDCEAANLGLAKDSEEILIKETTVVIHAAANVKFDQGLRLAANTNIRATRDILELAKLMSQLKAFVYVSTAYSNCPHSDIKEEFYDAPMTAKQLFGLLDGVDDELLEHITPRLIGKWPNSYVFTKTIAEDLIKSVGKSLPIAIVRPAIVISSIEEPFPGWIDNFYGVIGIVTGAALGALRSLNAKLNYTAQLVPCDYVANAVLAAASTIDEKESDIAIYNYAGSSKNFITWKGLMQFIETCGWDYPSEKQIWYYSFNLRENVVWHKICVFFLHTVLAYIVDFVLVCIGREAIAVKSYRKIDKMLSLTSYFSMRTWNFHCGNVDKLWGEMKDDDKKLFCFNMDNVDWASYVESCVIGGRVYLLKDPLDTLPQGARKLRILRVAHYTSITVFFCLLFMLLRWILSLVFRSFLT